MSQVIGSIATSKVRSELNRLSDKSAKLEYYKGLLAAAGLLPSSPFARRDLAAERHKKDAYLNEWCAVFGYLTALSAVIDCFCVCSELEDELVTACAQLDQLKQERKNIFHNAQENECLVNEQAQRKVRSELNRLSDESAKLEYYKGLLAAAGLLLSPFARRDLAAKRHKGCVPKCVVCCDWLAYCTPAVIDCFCVCSDPIQELEDELVTACAQLDQLKQERKNISHNAQENECLVIEQGR
ncbi:hypothetical protein EB796_004009 [Bugula neritina]|uniref:Uncharacterized protein n=1 Tax=Bugula neritina TaxID=10212 RepID=A0A7J7KG92_BUGNE|nr:hypothetical protein EB796_004009 [Bugula neritina]